MAGMIEYVALRVLRRFVFTERFLSRFGHLVPYYRVNANQTDGDAVAELYCEALRRAGCAPESRPVVVEIGSGATNTVGYALARRDLNGLPREVILFEPLATFDAPADEIHRTQEAADVVARVRRVSSLADVRAGSVDLLLSHSVLEHVSDLAESIREAARVLSPSGMMIHAVDYRDHFFKYPFHFLLFSRRMWERWLNPGDLPRWRLGQHLAAFRSAGFEVRILDSATLPEEFDRVRDRVHAEFDASDPHFAVSQATLVARRAAGA